MIEALKKAMKNPVLNVLISLAGILIIFFTLYVVALVMYPAK